LGVIPLKHQISKYKIQKQMQQHIINSNVKRAIVYLTSDQIPNEENFDFVLDLVNTCEMEEARTLLYDNYYQEILEWVQYSS
jgi:hypothetical protein